MESIDFRCQVRFLHRQRLFSPFELNTCASQFLASLKKQCANISSGDTRNNCIVRLSEPRGLRIVSGGSGSSSSSAAMGGSGSNRRSDEGFESDSEHSDHVAHNYAVLGGNGSNCMENECGNSSGVNSSGSDVDETDGVAKLQTAASVTSSSLSSSATTTVAERNSDILIESRVSDILSCQNPASLARVVLFTLRCEKRCDALDIIAVECSGVEAARILTRLCQKLCLSQQQQHQLKSAKMVVERTAKVQDSGKMATVSSIQSAIQNGSQRSSCRSKSSQRSAAPTQCGGPPSSTSQPPPVTMASGHQVETGNTREMIRRLERQKSWMEGAPKSLSSSQRSSYRASRACGEPALDNTCHHIQQQQADGCVTNKDTPKLKIGNRDTCIVSLQTPDMPLTAATRQSRRDSSCVVAKRESVAAAAAVMNKVDAHLPRPPVSLKKKPSLLNHLLNDELEAVLQAQIAERTNVKQAQVTKNDSAAKSVNGASQAPTKLKRDKSKTRSFLSKFTGSHDKAASESQQSHQQPPQQANGETKKVERGRSMMRSSTPWNRTPSQPAPTNRNHISTSNHTASNHGNNNNNNNNTFLIPTKSGQEFTNSPYPKDAPVANYMQQHPIYLSAPAAFPVHLAFPRPAAFSAVAPPWYWPTNEADANHAANSIATSTDRKSVV